MEFMYGVEVSVYNQNGWALDETFYSEDEAREYLKREEEKWPYLRFRLVRRPIISSWEVVE